MEVPGLGLVSASEARPVKAVSLLLGRLSSCLQQTVHLWHTQLEPSEGLTTFFSVGAKVTSREHESGLPITLNGTRLLP